jgi:ribosome-dependent ATPase
METLTVSGVSVVYKKRKGIENASFEAQGGEIVGFIGADGAGKSSLIHAIAGVGRFKGEIVFTQRVYHSPRETEPFKKEIALMPQGIGLVLYETLTVEEHLDFFANIRNIRQDTAFQAYKQRLLHMAGLGDFVNREAGKLSGGMMQKLSLICTLLHRPRLLLLDEPTTGVDPLSRKELWEILEDIKKTGAIIIVSTAYMQEAAKMDKILLFDEGKIIAQGKVETLLQSVQPYTYKKTICDEGCLHFGMYTYSLTPLPVEHAPSTLEALFFVNALKKKISLPKITIKKRQNPLSIPEVVMEAKSLTKRFGDFIACDQIDMILKKGEVVGLLGANGAGKTTFIKMLLGLYPIDGGSLFLLGKKIKSGKDRQGLKAKIGYVSQHFALYKDMTVRENLLYFANMHLLDPQVSARRIVYYAEALGFSAYLESMPTELPLGINQRFSITAALLHEPVLLFLDEPTSGVDTIARAQFWQLLRELVQEWGISILITTHYMSEAEYCDRVVLLKEGKKVADDSVEALHQKHPSLESFEDIFLEYYR